MISGFRGKWRFLSNFWLAPVRYGELEYPTLEHAYQAAKTTDYQIRLTIRRLTTPGEAKRYGKSLLLRPDWEQSKLSIMEMLLRDKFSREPMRSLLLTTGQAELVEENWWGDRFWGVHMNQGQNHLGLLLMKIRQELELETGRQACV